eukprot:gene399-47_t
MAAGSYSSDWDALLKRVKNEDVSSYQEALEFIRQHKLKRPDIEMLCGTNLVLRGSKDSEYWTIVEQTFLAALHLGDQQWADYCFKVLHEQFPESNRVKRLAGIFQEASCDYEKAKKLYESILEDKPEDMQSRKRIVACYKAQGRFNETIDQMNKYLDIFSTDADMWFEMAKMYITAGNLPKAGFCFEEILLANMRSGPALLTYAELMYSMKNYAYSRKYYSAALQVDDRDLRALWGFSANTVFLGDVKGQPEDDEQSEKVVDELGKMCLAKLEKIYSGHKGKHCEVALDLIAEHKDLANN